jgi:sigma-54 specific flagellar transcriptional regulator A
LRLRAPSPTEEQDALWAASADLRPDVLHDGEAAETESPLPHPSHYKDWFAYFDTIDLRRHLQDVEIVLIEAALEKSDGMVSHAADSLKLRRTTLIEKMKKLLIQKPIV